VLRRAHSVSIRVKTNIIGDILWGKRAERREKPMRGNEIGGARKQAKTQKGREVGGNHSKIIRRLKPNAKEKTYERESSIRRRLS